MKKRNHTRVKFISSVKLLVHAGASIICERVFNKQMYGQEILELNGKYSLAVDVETDFHIMKNEFLFEFACLMKFFIDEFGINDFEIIVIEYQGSKSPNIRRFDEYAEDIIDNTFGTDIKECLINTTSGDRESAERLYEYVAQLPLDEKDTLCSIKIMTAFNAIRDSNAIPSKNLIEKIKERLEFARVHFIDSDDVSLFSWIEAACLKARAFVSPASNTQRRTATI